MKRITSIILVGVVVSGVLGVWWLSRDPGQRDHSGPIDPGPVEGTGITTSASADQQRRDDLAGTGEQERRTPPTVAGVEADDGAVVGSNKVALADDYFMLERDRHLETFMSEDPDIQGLNAFMGDLAMHAELDPRTVQLASGGETTGEFTIPGSNMRVEFTISADGYSIALPGEMSPRGIDHVGARAMMGWRGEEAIPTEVYGGVQFLARDEYERNALDGRIVGYVYDFRGDEMDFRPMRGRMKSGLYQLTLPSAEANETRIGADLRPAMNWNTRLREIDTVEAALARQEATQKQR